MEDEYYLKLFRDNNFKYNILSKKQLIDKWENIGKIECDCNHNIKCKKCLGDGKCIYCIKYQFKHPKNMCLNWQKGYTDNYIISNTNYKKNGIIKNYEDISLVPEMS